jgi:hypothetical protein
MFFNFPSADTRLASVWCLDKLFGGIAGLLVDIEISITDLRNAVYPATPIPDKVGQCSAAPRTYALRP